MYRLRGLQPLVARGIILTGEYKGHTIEICNHESLSYDGSKKETYREVLISGYQYDDEAFIFYEESCSVPYGASVDADIRWYPLGFTTLIQEKPNEDKCTP